MLTLLPSSNSTALLMMMGTLIARRKKMKTEQAEASEFFPALKTQSIPSDFDFWVGLEVNNSNTK